MDAAAMQVFLDSDLADYLEWFLLTGGFFFIMAAVHYAWKW